MFDLYRTFLLGDQMKLKKAYSHQHVYKMFRFEFQRY